MMKNKVIITMAGEGSRFKKIGFKIPKHEIVANGKTLFEWSLLSLKDFFADEFVFIVRKNNYNLKFIEEKCESLNIASYSIVEVDKLTDGQASTVLAADSVLDENDSISIFNIDTYIDPNEIKRSDIKDTCAGFIPTFIAEGDKWSFVNFDKNYKVTKVTEKVRISEYGTVGFYYFSNWGEYKKILNIYKKEIIRDYKEAYIAPMYKYLIDKGLDVYGNVINGENISVLGTPEDISKFDKNYLVAQADCAPKLYDLESKLKYSTLIEEYKTVLLTDISKIYDFIKLLGELGELKLLTEYYAKYNVATLIQAKSFKMTNEDSFKYVKSKIMPLISGEELTFKEAMIQEIYSLAMTNPLELKQYLDKNVEEILEKTSLANYSMVLTFAYMTLLRANLLTPKFSKPFIINVLDSKVFNQREQKYLTVETIDYMNNRNDEYLAFTFKYSQIQRMHYMLYQDYERYETAIRKYVDILYSKANIEDTEAKVLQVKKKQVKNPRVAVCISGMARGDVEEYNKKIQKNVVEPLNADVFIHTWENREVYPGIGGVGSTKNRNWQQKYFTATMKKCPKDIAGLADFTKTLPTVSNLITTPIIGKNELSHYTSTFKDAQVIIEAEEDFLGRFDDTYDFERRGSKNQIKMFYGIWKSHDMAREYMQANDFEYDYIVKVRIDSIIDEKVSMDMLTDLKYNELCTKFNSITGPQDRVYYGTYDTVMKIASIWEKAVERKDLSPLIVNGRKLKIDAHKLLFSHATYENIYIKPANLIPANQFTKTKVPDLTKALAVDLEQLPAEKQEKYKKYFELVMKKNGVIK